MKAEECWRLVFAATKDTSFKVMTTEGEEIKGTSFYDKETQSLILEIPKTAITKAIDVVFPEGLQIAEKNMLQRIMPILEKAQMDNNVKAYFWNKLKEEPEKASDLIMAADFNESVKGSLLEIVLA